MKKELSEKNIDELGDLYSIHKSAAGISSILYLGAGCVVLALILIIIVADAQLELKDNNSKNYLLIAVAVVLPAGLYLLYGYYQGVVDEVRVYNHGLVYTTRKNVQIIKADEIEFLWQAGKRIFRHGVEVAIVMTYVLKLTDGRMFELGPPFEDTEGLGDRLEQWIVKYRMPHILAKLNGSETVKLGKFEINQSQLMCKDQALSLSNLGEIRVDNGEVAICRKDNGQIWVSTSYGSIPNASIFLNILNQISRQS